MITDHAEAPRDDLCPKRPWVMSTMADDEATSNGSHLPRGLRLHLSHCDICRAAANEVVALMRSLDAMADEQPPDDLLRCANSQATRALRAGGRLTGRVRVPDDQPFPIIERASRPRRRYASLAAAAAIVIMVGVWGVRSLSGSRAGNRKAESSLLREGLPPGDAWAPAPASSDALPSVPAGRQQSVAIIPDVSGSAAEATDPEVAANDADDANGQREQVVDGGPGDSARRARSNICPDHSPVDAAPCAPIDRIPRAVNSWGPPVPDAEVPDLIDTPPSTVSTTPQPKDH